MSPFGDARSETPLKERVGPEIHGGPEGLYEKDNGTGRWRSVSRSCTRLPQAAEMGATEARLLKVPAGENPRKAKQAPSLDCEAWKREVDRLEDELLGEFDRAQEEIGAACDPLRKGRAQSQSVSPRRAAQLATARADAEGARAETARFWKAVKAGLSNAALVAELERADELARAKMEVEFERKRREEIWEALRNAVDGQTLAALTRTVFVGSAEERALSVGIARRMFERKAEQPAAGPPRRAASRTSLHRPEAPCSQAIVGGTAAYGQPLVRPRGCGQTAAQGQQGIPSAAALSRSASRPSLPAKPSKVSFCEAQEVEEEEVRRSESLSFLFCKESGKAVEVNAGASVANGGA
eukprot:TRINITY_DN20941_c0_g1_i1.p1 TRINITY_DN20941_c0_g1~~TRINITY_DN20941_c0_g1_i1.p1  ORF type:complete len:354 (+),score=69.98 TRINITY_DN20941_c0_g1_i1:55-1116(+)